MFTLNVRCRGCKSNFKSCDVITSSECGHLFHLGCFRQRLRSNGTCELCLGFCLQNKEIFLNIENSSEYEKVVSDLKAQLQAARNTISDMLKESSEKNKVIIDIRSQYNMSEKRNADQEDKIHKLSNELQLQKEMQSKEERLDLENKNDDELLKIIDTLKVENLKLAKNLKDSEESKMFLNYKIEIQEQRLKHMAIELDKEVTEGLKYKLQLNLKENNLNLDKENENVEMLYKNICTLTLEKEKLAKNLKDSESSHMILNHKIQTQEQILKNIAKQISEGLNYKFKQDSVENVNELHTKQVPLQLPSQCNKRNERRSNANRKMLDSNKFACDNCKILIIDFPKCEILQPLALNVILLATKMEISLTHDDIASVGIINNKQIFNKVKILVEFKTIDNKVLFLKNRNRLKLHEMTKAVIIKDYIDEATYRIFTYANRKLRSNGYEFVCYKNDKVIAKKRCNDIEEIIIKNLADVDSLIACQTKDKIMESTTNLTDRSASVMSITSATEDESVESSNDESSVFDFPSSIL